MKIALALITTFSLSLFTFNNPVKAAPEGYSLALDPQGERHRASIPNYIGVGASIGLENDEESANIFTKIGLTDSISIRPSMLIQDELAVDMPITYDITVSDNFSPYLGIGPGVIFKDDDTDINPIATAGVDVKLSRQFIANVNVKTDVTDTDDLAVSVGLGYSLP